MIAKNDFYQALRGHAKGNFIKQNGGNFSFPVSLTTACQAEISGART